MVERVDVEYEGWRLPFAGRRGCLWAGLVATLLAAAVLGLRLYAASRLDEVAERSAARLGPVDPAAYQVARVAPAENVALRSREVAAMVRPAEVALHEQLVRRAARRPAATWGAAERAAVRDHPLANAAALARARGLRRTSGSDLGIDYADPSAPLPDFLPLTTTRRLLRLHAGTAALDGDPRVALDSVAALGRLAEGLYAEPHLIGLILAVSIEEAQILSMRELLAAGPADRDLVAELDDTRIENDLFAALRRGLGYEAATRIHQARADGMPPGAAELPARWQLVGLLVGDLLTARGLRPTLAAANAGELPLPVLQRSLRAARPSHPLGPWEASRPESMVEKVYALATERLLARAALAVAKHAATDGAWPSALPRPVREPVTGAEIVYRRREDGSAEIAAPGAEAVLEESGQQTPEELLRWVLPAP